MLHRKAAPFIISFILLLAILLPLLAGGHAHLQRAELALQQGDKTEAAGALAHAAHLLFWRTELYEQAGILAAQAEDPAAALAYFSKTQINTEEGWLWLCTAHIQNNDLLTATNTCTIATQKFDSAALYRLLAYLHRTQSNWQAEKTALENQTRLNPQDAYAAYRLGLLRTLFTPETALPELTRAATLNPEVDSSVQTLRAALAVSSQQTDLSMGQVVIGQAFGLLQDWPLAQFAFEQALKINAENAEAWAWLGEAKQQNGQDGGAALNRALDLNRDSIQVRALRGLYWSRQAKYDQMLAEYLRAADLEPENPRWRVSVAEAYTKRGDLVSALQAYQQAVDLAPTTADTWRLLAVFCAENAVQVETLGLPAAQQALALAPNDPAVLDALGFVYLSSGRYANAEQTLSEAVKITPDYFSAHIHLSITYLAQGNLSAAFNTLTYVRDADLNGPYAETARQLLAKHFP